MYLSSNSIVLKKTLKGVFILRGLTKIQFKNLDYAPLIEKIISYSKKPITEADLLKCFDAIHRNEIQEIILILIKNRILNFRKDDLILDKYYSDTPEDIYYWHLDLKSYLVRKDLESISLRIIGINDFSIALLKLLKESGFSHIRLCKDLDLDSKPAFPHKFKSLDEIGDGSLECERVDCVIAIAPLNQRNILRYWNNYYRKKAIPFFPVLIDNLHAYIGPYVNPKQKICFECASLRFASNTQDSDLLDIQQFLYDDSSIYGYHPNMIAIISGMAAMEILNNFTQRPNLYGKVISYNSITQQTNISTILQVPYCPVCGEGNA